MRSDSQNILSVPSAFLGGDDNIALLILLLNDSGTVNRLATIGASSSGIGNFVATCVVKVLRSISASGEV